MRDATGSTLFTFNIFSMPGLILVTVLHTFPFVYLLTSAAFASVDSSYEESAQILGAGKLRTLWSVTFPLVAPAILSGALIGFVNAIALFGSQAIIGLPARIFTLPTRIYALFDYPPEYGLASALSLVFIAITVIALYLQRSYLARRSYVTLAGKGARPQRIALGMLRWPLFAFCVVVFVIAVFLPYASLLAVSLSKSWGLEFWKNLTFKNYHFILFEYDVTRRAIVNSLLLATLAATFCVFLGTAIGWIDLRTRFMGRKFVDYVSLVPLGLPGIVMAAALIQFWLRLPLHLYGTLAILFLAYAARYLPLGVRSANAALRQIDPSLEESARIRSIVGPDRARNHLAADAHGALRRLAANIRSGDPRTLGLDLALQLEVDDAGRRGLQPLRKRLYRAGRGARPDQCRNHRRGHLHRAETRRQRDALREHAELMAGIELRNVSKTYAANEDGHAAVADVSLTVASGEFVTLLGPSGCGKTTTLRLIAGYLIPDAGEISVDGRLLSSPKNVVPPESRGMGMVFQNYAVWPHKTVFENVVFGLRLRNVSRDEARERVGRVLDMVNLAGLESRYPSELSGGQQQRVALARSLVVEPAVLLLDEPLSNLDAKLRERMRSELKTLQRRTGITFIYVTHDQTEALALSDHIAVMHDGRLQQYGTPREVYLEPANHIVADFMGLVNLIPAVLTEVAGSASSGEESGMLAASRRSPTPDPASDGRRPACTFADALQKASAFLTNLAACGFSCAQGAPRGWTNKTTSGT